MKLVLRLLPWAFLALFAIEIIAVFAPKKDGEYHVREFGRLPVLLNGRIQPFDSVARNALLQIRSTGEVPLEEVPGWKFWHHPKKLKATEWLLEVMTRPEDADRRPIFLIHLPDLLGELKLQDLGVEKSGLRYYTYAQIKPVLPEVEKQAGRVFEREQQKLSTSEQRSVFEKQLLKLANAVALYRQLKFTLQPDGADDFSAQLVEFQKDLVPARAAAQANAAGNPSDAAALRKIAAPLQEFQQMSEYGYALVVPPAEPAQGRERWQNMGAALLESAHSGVYAPALTHLAAIATAYRAERAGDFNDAVAGYQQWLKPDFARELQKGRAEFFYNDTKSFLHAMIIYLFAFVLACTALLTLPVAANLSESLRRSAFYLILLAGLVHTFGLVFRMVLEGRPPVTNLYSSAIFIGWSVVVLGLILERLYRAAIGSLVAAIAGFGTLVIAHNLALGGDTMEMLRAVLDTNGWLASHVVTVTLGYASTFAAGGLAIVYVLLGVFTPQLQHTLGATAKPMATSQALSKMVYGIVCFATLFSFIGTVLGGIWADQSWGRFWGWDPKENGALLIVLWNGIILHARWGKLLSERGIMNLAIFGNIVTCFSWFGVNLLGVGLHSYGFTDTGAEYLVNFILGQCALLGTGLISPRMWKSFAGLGDFPARSVRTIVASMSAAWFIAALLWFGAVYTKQSYAWYSGLYESLPWLGSAAKAAAYATVGTIWLTAAASWILPAEETAPQPHVLGKPALAK